MNYRKLLLLLAGGILSVVLMSAEVPDEKQKIIEHVGFIFSSDNILLDLNDYKGGVGVKLMTSDFSMRFMADFGYSKSTGILSGDIGFTLEKPIRTGRIVPYWGGGIQMGIEYEKIETDADNWITQLNFPLELTAIVGVEIFIVEFLSIFAEYNLAIHFAASNTKQSNSGVVNESSNWTWAAATGLGNQGRLGIVLYLDDVAEIEKK